MTTKPLAPDIYFTNSAMTKLRALHPRCGITGARALYETGDLLTPAEVVECGLHRPENHIETIFVVDRDNDGVFIVVPSFGDLPFVSPFTCVTYRRFNRQERALCMDVLDERDTRIDQAA